MFLCTCVQDNIYIQNKLLQISRLGLKKLALLIDPDDDMDVIADLVEKAIHNGVDLFFVGGSFISQGNTEKTTKLIKDLGAEMVILFPGNEIQVNKHADAILFMSLISGRNSEYLIGKQVVSAPLIRKLRLPTIPTGYILVESGKLTSAHYISQTFPIPSDKPDIAAATALAGSMLGMQVMYLDAGSGAQNPVSGAMIQAVKEATNSLTIVGGGITSLEQAKQTFMAGADILVIGNGAVSNTNLIADLSELSMKLSKTQKAL